MPTRRGFLGLIAAAIAAPKPEPVEACYVGVKELTLIEPPVVGEEITGVIPSGAVWAGIDRDCYVHYHLELDGKRITERVGFKGETR